MQRLTELKQWLSDDIGIEYDSIEPASSDASFRRYFRLTLSEDNSRHSSSLIAMDAPPTHEDSEPFVKIAKLFKSYGLNVPEILHINLERGFLLLSDLGDTQYLPELTEQSVDKMYGDALQSLYLLQTKTQSKVTKQEQIFPPYDHELLMREMELFREWYLQKHLAIELTSADHTVLDNAFEQLAQQALKQTTVCVHRDYHSRNLMLVAEDNPGILDFQDAVIGPVTYDLVSLLRDCYVAWPRQQVESWALEYLHRLQASGIIEKDITDEQLLKWFDWMGVQRHLKATGIFARLNHRDGKPGYLNDIPRTLSYVRDVTSRYDELADFNQLIEKYSAT